MEKKSNTLKLFSERLNAKVLFIVNAIIIYALIYYVAYQVPLQSDDYGYFQQGLALKAHISHYFAWSGRFITDYTSAILLKFFRRPVYMAINSLVLLVVTIIISILPNIVRRKKVITRGSSIILWIIFMLYWVSNPNLGQTSFWLVGSTNYLWTLMWASIYFAYFLSLLVSDAKTKVKQCVILFLMGIFAGLSNESLGLMVVLFTICLLYMFWKGKKLCLIVGLLSSSIGYAFMYFAPGNKARLSFDEFKDWRELPFVEKFLLHVFDRMPSALGGFYIVYLIFILILVATLWVQNGKKIDVMSYTFSFLYCALSVCAICAFVVVPTMPPRSENTSLYFLLLAVSFIANIMNDTEKKEGVILLLTITSVCGIYFIISYTFMSYAYVQTKSQADIREKIIEEAKANGEDTAIIPDWYFTRLTKDLEKFDTFRSGAMPSYYGLDNIEWQATTFNYAVIENTKPISINEQVKDGLTLTNMYVKLNAPFEQTVVFEFDNSLMDFIQEGDRVFYFHLNVDGREGFINADLGMNDFMRIGDKYYYGRTIMTPRIDKLSSIDYGFYNWDTKISSVSRSLDFKNYYNR